MRLKSLIGEYTLNATMAAEGIGKQLCLSHALLPLRYNPNLGLLDYNLCEEEGADRNPIAESDSVVFAYLFYLRVLYAYYIGYS
jgi:hypothetical protein